MRLAGAADARQHGASSLNETQLPIKFNSACVGGGNVEERHDALLHMIPRDLCNQACRKPLPTVLRVCAHAADFRVTIQRKALTGHRNELTALVTRVQPNTIVGSHLVRVGSKEAGESQVC